MSLGNFWRSTTFAFLLVLNVGYGYAETFEDSIPNVKVMNKFNQASQDKLMKPITISVATTTLGLFTYRFFDTKIKNATQKNQNEFATDFFINISYAGLGKANTAAGLALGISAFATKNNQLKKATINFIGAHLINDFITNQMKMSFQRHRPNTGDPYNTFDWRKGDKINKSFISAHTSNIFTTATVLALSFKDEKWVPPTVYTLATLVGLSRIYLNAHWASDVIGGAVVGYLSARLMDKLYSTLGQKFSFVPFGGRQVGILISYVF